MAKWQRGVSGNAGGRPKEIGEVRALALLAGGELASGSTDNSIRVWTRRAEERLIYL
jgi:hypothetical protein